MLGSILSSKESVTVTKVVPYGQHDLLQILSKGQADSSRQNELRMIFEIG